MSINKLLSSSGDEESYGEMEDIDISLNYDNPDFMSSEFFDSVLSLENNMEEGFLSNFDDDINLSSDASSHTDEDFSPRSLNSESDKNSTCMETVDESAVNSVDGFDDPLLLSFSEAPNFPIDSDVKPLIINSVIQKQQQTNILIQNPNNKKVISKHINTVSPRHISIKGTPQILKVHPITNNGGQVLLPLNVKSIKILKTPASVAALTGELKRRKIDTSHNSPNEINSNVVSSSNQYPLLLSQEEKRLLAKEGIQLPTHHPLTKNEERELKRIRRKIRNKISAQDSRKRKKEYVDGLEERVKRGSEENKNLLHRVRVLQRQNKTLIAHVNKLQTLIRNSTTSKATPSTCLMVVLLSALLVSLPNIKLFQNKQASIEQEQVAIRRSLLSSPQATEDNTLNMEEFLVFRDEDKSKFDEEVFDIENSTDKEFSKMFEDMEKEYESLVASSNKSKKGIFSRVFETFKNFLEKEKPELYGKIDYGGYNNGKGFIEPDIDEYISNEDGPPLKRIKFTAEESSNDITKNGVILTTGNNRNFGIHTKDK